MTSRTERGELGEIERAIEQLLRLSSSRNVHARRMTAAGVTISPPGLALLRRLRDEGPLALGELARRTNMDPAAAGRQTRQLEESGFVAKKTSAGDGRVTLVRVTPKGRDALRRISAVGDRHMTDVLDAWSKSDRAALARLLPRLVDGMRAVHYRAEIDDEQEEEAV